MKFTTSVFFLKYFKTVNAVMSRKIMVVKDYSSYCHYASFGVVDVRMSHINLRKAMRLHPRVFVLIQYYLDCFQY